MPAYYNEFDPFAAAWLRELIKAGHIAPGDVDTRSIEDVTPDDLRSYTQCHFFAGIGVWSYALRQAGWPDDRPVWTGSCPCQPFSSAGKGGGFDDERHLWPHFNWLISQRRPPVVIGEQVASKDGLAWLDLVQADLEGAGYASGAVDLCAAGVGAPHIRQRLYWVGARVADAQIDGRRQGVEDGGGLRSGDSAEGTAGRSAIDSDVSGGMANAIGANYRSEEETPDHWKQETDRSTDRVGGRSGASGGVADADRAGTERWAGDDGQAPGLSQAERQSGHGAALSQRAGENSSRRGVHGSGGLSGNGGPTGPVNGLWRDADWLLCRDGKWRPVRPSAQQMVDGSTASLGRLRDSSIREIEAAVEAWAIRHQRDGTEAVRNLWDFLSSEEVGQRQDGGFDSVREAPFLLALLRQLSDQGWKFPVGAERASSEASRTALRVLRFDEQAAYSSRGRGLDEQQPGEPTDPLQELSQIVAHFAEECWGLSGWQNVGSFPLVSGARARVGRLRGYGNALNAVQAQVFVEEVMQLAGE